MDKISSAQAKHLLKTAASTIRTQSQKITNLKTKVASFEKMEKVSTIAKEMEDKGLHGDLSFEEKVAHLAGAKNLDVTEEAVKMASPQSQIFAEVGEDGPPGSPDGSALETYILTGESPE